MPRSPRSRSRSRGGGGVRGGEERKERHRGSLRVRGEAARGRDARSGSNYASCVARRRLRPLAALPVAGLLTGGDIFFSTEYLLVIALRRAACAFAPLQQATIPICIYRRIAEQCSHHFLSFRITQTCVSQISHRNFA